MKKEDYQAADRRCFSLAPRSRSSSGSSDQGMSILHTVRCVDKALARREAVI